MRPLDPDLVPHHMRHLAGTTGLVHGPAPVLPRPYVKADAMKDRKGRKGAKARAKMKRILKQRYGIT